MKIKKIAQIKNVGVFKDHSNNNIEFQDINFIYANNASGKTTLVDILKDVSENNDDRIQNRKTIPDNGNQFIRIVTKENEHGASEKNLIYENSRWKNNTLKDKILIFDTDFIESNVFSGLKLLDSKDTKANFSGFILGDSGVLLAKERSSINNQLTDERKLLKASIPESRKDSSYTDKEIKEYCETKIRETLADLETAKVEVQSKIKLENDLLANTKAIESFQSIPYVNVEDLSNFESVLVRSDVVLKKTFEVNTEDWKTYQAHLENHFPSVEIGRQWIEEGMEYSLGQDNCPFCGQNLDESRMYLNYKLIFSDDFSHYSNSVRTEIEENLIKIKDISFKFSTTDVFSKFQAAQNLFGKSFEIPNSFSVHIENLDEWIKESLKKLIIEKDQLKAALESKKIVVNEVMNFNFNKIRDLLCQAKKICKDLNNDIQIMNKNIEKLKMKSVTRDTSLLKEYEAKLNEISIKIRRINEENECSQWLNHYRNIESLSIRRDEKDNELQTSQEEYLNKYFGDINSYFTKFGGHNYRLERGATNKRYKEPVIGVNIYFKDIDVSDRESSKLFSESDRRALALSIFVAKIKNLSREELEKMILIFDDPVTSFDGDRMTPVCKSIIELSDLVNQIFILSHQYNFSEKMFANFGGKKYLEEINPPKYFMISKTGLGFSSISELDPIKFFNHKFLKQYDKISSFIDGEHDNLTGNDLRIFIEDYLTVAFPKLHCDVFSKKYYPLEEIITQLNDQGYITETVSIELKRYKDTLNPASHRYQHFTLQELRNYSREILNYLDDKFRLD